MERVMKFPKEKAQLVNRIIDAYENENYHLVISYKDEILSNFEVVKDEKVFEMLLEAYFNFYSFDDVIMIGDELIKNAYESFDMYYYMLLSLIALTDIYQAKNLIRKSLLLNGEGIKYYYTVDGANYSNILGLSFGLFVQAAPCLLIVNYVSEVAKEMAGDITLDHEYLLFRFFDLINMIYELGYEDDIVLKLEKALKIIFEIEV
jgi:hypothetical protein